MVIRNFGQRPYSFSQNLQLTEKLMRLLIGFFAVFFSVVSASAEDKLSAAIASIDADVVFMRHALAPGFGDPANFALGHCATQRNLDNVGRKQAMEIGAEIRRSATNFTEVLSSEWCRCNETAELLGAWAMGRIFGIKFLFSRLRRQRRRFEKVGTKTSPVGTRCDLDGDPSSCHHIGDRTGRWKR